MKNNFFFSCKLLLLCFLLSNSGVLKAGEISDTLSFAYIGNWINNTSNLWEYGLYEKFAIYETDFWEYKKIESNKKEVLVTLEKDGKEIHLRLRKTRQGEIKIAQDGKRFQAYQPAQKGFLPYAEQDSTFFQKYPHETDSVTILGYYRNLDSLPQDQRRTVAEFSKNDYLLDKSVNFLTDIDTLGRFRIRLPVVGLEKFFIDWGFLTQEIWVVPGEKLLFCADILDLMKRNSIKRNSINSEKEYWTYNQNVLFMGENARFHNEMSHCPPTINIRQSSELWGQKLSDMEALKIMEGDYRDFLKKFEQYKQKYPTLSRKCTTMVELGALYHFAASTMQYRYGIYKKRRVAFEEGYMKFVETNFPLDCEWYYLADSYLPIFVENYIGYKDGLRDQFSSDGSRWSMLLVQTKDVLECIKAEKLGTSEELGLIDDYLMVQAVSFPVGDTMAARKHRTENRNTYNLISDYLKSSLNVSEIQEWLLTKRVKEFYDTLLPNVYLKELQMARYYMSLLDEKHQPFSDRMLSLLDEYITNPTIRQRVEEANDVFRKIHNKKISWLESLKSSTPLKGYEDAKALFQELIAPYRGSVIYLDIWGTWCSPCREQMTYMGAVKEALKGENVVYMYLASQSDKNVWKNLIREYNLTGENVVHYCLPDEQQEMVEKLLNVDSFPTFMLLDKDGEIVNPKASWPREKEKLVSEIKKLLGRQE